MSLLVEPTVRTVGQVRGGYGPVLAACLKDLLGDPKAHQPLKALVGHTAAIPALHILEKHTQWETLFAFDDRADNVAYQQSKTVDHERVQIFQTRVSELPEVVEGLDVVVNPFGLQEYPGEELAYAEQVRSRAKVGATMWTFDWGLTDYDEQLRVLPGIREEIAFSESRQVPVFTQGWQLEQETWYRFFIRHTQEQIEAILPRDAIEPFREATGDTPIVDVHSTVIARVYRAV